MVRNRNKSKESEEDSVDKFLRERKEKAAKRKKREEKRRAKLLKPKDMGKAFPDKPGIYKIINKRTGEVFVSYSQNMAYGINNHLFKLKTHKHDNPDLQDDYDKGDRFDVSILKEYPSYDHDEIMRDVKDFIESENSFYRGYNRHIGGNYSQNKSYGMGNRLDGRPMIRKTKY